MKKRNQNNQKEISSLAELSVVAAPEIPNLEIEEVSEESIAALEKQAEEVRQNAGAVSKFVKRALAFSEQTKALSREAKERCVEKLKAAEEGLKKFLWETEEPAYRRAAWLAYFQNRLEREPKSIEEAKEIFVLLAKDGFLVPNPEGKIKFGGAFYQVPERSGFGEPEIVRLSDLAEALATKTKTIARVQKREQMDSLFAQSDLTIEDLIAGKAGKIALGVPPEEIPSREENGQSYWRPGGTILVQSDGKTLHPVDWVGNEGFTNAVREIQELRVFLIVGALGKDTPPYLPNLGPERGRKLQLFWHLCKRAIRAAEKEKKEAATRDIFVEQATITPEEFFLGEPPKKGVCLAEFRGTWQTPDNGTIGNLYFLVERAEEDGSNAIILLDLPDHLREFLGDRVGQSFPEGEQRFDGIPHPLRAVLQAIYGQTQKAAKVASSKEQR